MHWAYETATALLKKYPKAETLTCSSGVSPSGYVHVGNFREVATTYFVVKALKDLGARPRFILSWDDYDRLRKIPVNVSNISETEIGKPYTKIPSPDGKTTYADYFESLFEKDLKKMGITPEYIYETIRYESGAYDQQLIRAMKERKKIYDILADFRTEAPDEKDRENYYPISLYCQHCGHDSTKIEYYDEADHAITYSCACGHHGTQIIGQHQTIKLHWKIDWPMRWQYEEVAFEPGGKDHSSKNGSFDVASVIVKEIFDYHAPVYQPYDFVNIKGQTKKMSSSAGNIFTLDELADIYTPELIFYLYAKYLPKAQFNLGLDDDVLRNYDEFERKVAVLKNADTPDENLRQLLYLTGIDLQKNYPSFSHTVNILALTNNNQALTQEILKKEATYTQAELDQIVPRAAYWIENDAKNRLLTIQEQKDQNYYATLTPKVQKQLAAFVTLLKNKPDLQDQDLMQAVYDLSSISDKKEKRLEQKNLFQAIYHLTLGQDSGPRIPLLVKVIGKDKLLSLLA